MKRNEIQWLRAIAASEVVICHSDLIVKSFSSDRIVMNSWYQPLVSVGVELFFIVSGYIMCMRAPVTRSGWSFIVARIVRIYPLYWLYTTAVVLVGTIVPAWRLGEFNNDFATFVNSYLILPQWGFPILGVGWTLEYEMVFYLLVTIPMVFGMMRGRQMIAFAWVLALLGCLGSVLEPKTEGLPLLMHIASPYMFAFGIGWLFRCLEQADRIEQIGSMSIFLAIAAVAVWLGPQWSDHLLFRMAVAAMVFAAFLLGRRIFQVDNGVNRLLWLIGDASYSIYLSHWFVLSAGGKLLGALGTPAEFGWAARIVGFVVSIIVGICSFYYIEQPISRLLRRRRAAMSLPAPGPAAGRLTRGAAPLPYTKSQ